MFRLPVFVFTLLLTLALPSEALLPAFMHGFKTPVIIVHEYGHVLAADALFFEPNTTVSFDYCHSLPFLICRGSTIFYARQSSLLGSLLGTELSMGLVYAGGHLAESGVLQLCHYKAHRTRSRSLLGMTHLLALQILHGHIAEYASSFRDRTHNAGLSDFEGVAYHCGSFLAHSYLALLVTITSRIGWSSLRAALKTRPLL